MKPCGAKRHYGKCIVIQAGLGRKVLIRQYTKSRKHGRVWSPELENTFVTE